jgi:hypothetical protein
MAGRAKRRPWNRVLDAALSGLLVGLLAAGPALARQPPLRLLPRALPSAAGPKITVLVVPLDPALQSMVPRLTYQAEQAVAGAGRFQLVRLADALEAQEALAREAEAELAAAAFQEGQKAYDELDTQKALQRFEKAAETYEKSDLSRHFTDMSRARVMKIASYVANGDTKEAEKALKDVLARNPDAEFSPNFFSPDQLALVEKTRQAVKAEANKTLEVKTGAVHAQVFVDGQFQGGSPLKLSGLSRGDHYVTVRAPGHALAQERVSGSEASITLRPLPIAQRLQALVERIVEEPEAMDRDLALRELGSLAGTQQVLALLVRAPGASPRDVIAIRLEASDGHNLGFAAGPVPSSGAVMDTAIQSLLSSVLGADAPRVDGKPATNFPSGGGGGRRTAGFVLLAAGAALLAGGTYFGLEAASKSDVLSRTPQTDLRSAKLRSDGKTFALLADIGIIAGVASAGTGTWLAFLSGDDGGEPEPQPAPPQPSPTRPPGRDPSPAPAEKPSTTPALKPLTTPAGKPAATPTDKPGTTPADKPATGPADKPTPAPETKPPASKREEEKRKREEEERLKREEEKRKREEEERLKREAEEKRKREEEEKRAREAEEKRKREEEERLKREEEEKRKREGQGKRKREEEERLKREEEEKRKREEEERLKREAEEKRKREEEEKRQREEEVRRKLEEEKKKRKPLDEDDLRNY